MDSTDSIQWVLDEFSDADLGDKRRTDRLLQMVERFSRNPQTSLPQFLGNEAELEGAYRLLSNPAVTDGNILHPHIQRSGCRVTEAETALVIHDTTDIRFSCYGDVLRNKLSRTSTQAQGFRLHTSLAISADGTRFPYGVLASRAYIHKNDAPDTDTYDWWKKRGGIMDNEQERWLQGIIQAEENAPDANLIHVCDREGDGYELLGSLVELERRFVIRLGQKRLVFTAEGERMELSDVLAKIPFIKDISRTIDVQPRYGKETFVQVVPKTKQYKKRRITLAYRATRVTVKRPIKRPDLSYIEAPTTLNIVEVVEQNPPDGELPVQWLLATSEPISTPEEVLQVVQHYTSRWVIEEYHKAIKTGCAYEKRQLESAHALLNTLSMTIPIAVHMLMLRHLVHVQNEMSAETLFSKEELLVMRALTSEKAIPKDVTLSQVIKVIAEIGGHVKANGPPGWQVIYRGYVELVQAKKGFLAAFKFMNMPLPEL